MHTRGKQASSRRAGGELRSKVTELESALKESDDKVATLETQMASFEKSLEEYRESNSSLEKDLNGQTAEVARLSALVSALEETRSALLAHQSLLGTEKAKREGELFEARGRIRFLEAECSALRVFVGEAKQNQGRQEGRAEGVLAAHQQVLESFRDNTRKAVSGFALVIPAPAPASAEEKPSET